MLNKRIVIYLIITILLTFIGCKNSVKQNNENVSLKMENPETQYTEDILSNMKIWNENDDVINSIYKDDISNVEKFTNSKTIMIEYYDFDLNDDDNIDKIVTIRSPLHSGSAGDNLDFLIGKNDGTYELISNLSIRLYGQMNNIKNAKMYIMNEKTNNFHDILIVNNDDTKKILKYHDGYYVIVDCNTKSNTM